MHIIVSRGELQAALLFASNDESRWILNSVVVEVQRGKAKPNIIATDARRLVVIETLAEQKDRFSRDHQLVMNAGFIKAICAMSKALGGKLFPWIQFKNEPGSKRVFIEFVGSDFYMEAEKGILVEGDYPGWRQVLPSTRKSARVGITDLGMNAEFVGDFAKAAKFLNPKSAPTIQMNLVGKEQQVEVKIPGLDHFYGLVMQCKLDESVDYQPEFVSIVNDLPPPPEPEPDEEERKEKEEE